MWRITAVAWLVALMGIAALSTQTSSVHACVPPIGDPLAGAGLIIEGRVVEYTAHAPADADQLEGYPVREEFTVEIVDVLVGTVDTQSVTITHDAWVGAGGIDCDVSPSNIDGQYIIMGLRERDDGTYGLPLSSVVFIGPEPQGEAYEAALQRIANLLEPVLPPVGTGPAPAATNHLLAATAALGAALLAASFAIRFGTGRKT